MDNYRNAILEELLEIYKERGPRAALYFDQLRCFEPGTDNQHFITAANQLISEQLIRAIPGEHSTASSGGQTRVAAFCNPDRIDAIRYELGITPTSGYHVHEIAQKYEWDVFISHATEDKNSLVRELADALTQKGLRVWYDELTLTIGDSLRRSIDRGLARSRYGIVVLSHSFFSKEWPQKELDGLIAKEGSMDKVVLPIWHNIQKADVAKYSPILSDRLAVSSEGGIDHIVNKILLAIS